MNEKMQAINEILGPSKGHRWEGITIEKVDQLLAGGHLDGLDGERDRGATIGSLIGLVRRHPDLRLRGIDRGDGTIALDGIDARKDPFFKQNTIWDFTCFALLYADEFTIAPDRLFLWCD